MDPRVDQKAWYELFKAERKFPTIKLDAKKTINILVKNIEPKGTASKLMQSMETGDEASQLMRNNLMNFHNRLVQIAEAINIVKSYDIVQSKSRVKPLALLEAVVTEKKARARHLQRKRSWLQQSEKMAVSIMDLTALMEPRNAGLNIHLLLQKIGSETKRLRKIMHGRSVNKNVQMLLQMSQVAIKM